MATNTDSTETEVDRTSDQYLAELINERDALENAFPHAVRLFTEEINRVQKKSTEKPVKMLELHEDKPTSVSVKVRLPDKEFPDIKFAGRIIGTKGAEMKKFQEKTGTRLFVFGKGSMVDKKKEEELRQAGGRYAHLSEDLHVQLQVFAHPVEAYRRLSVALHELRAYMNPDEPGHTNGGSQPAGFLPPQAPAMLHGPGPVGTGPIPGSHGVPAMQASPWSARFPTHGGPSAGQWPMSQEAGAYGMRSPYPEQARTGFQARGPTTPAADWSSYSAQSQVGGMTHHPAAGVTAGQYRVHPYGRGTAAPNGWGSRA